ncbi:MAG: hypothetical protein HS113_09395 [Verrucomicrobiales bacterium]|nr:hypothetical protein [Verrucomicrobiales bacterium]
MKTRSVVVLSLSVGGVAQAARLPLEDPPAGRVLEVHSCELLAGSCIRSSQATLQERNRLRVSAFAGGGHQGSQSPMFVIGGESKTGSPSTDYGHRGLG